MTGQHDKAVAEGEKAVALNPNSADSHMLLGKILTFAGRYEESIPELKTAIRLNPIPPNIYLFSLGVSYALTGQSTRQYHGVKKQFVESQMLWSARLFMAAVYGQAGQDKEARIEAAEVLRINPKFSLEKYAKSVIIYLRIKRIVERTFIAPLRKAGLK